MARSRSKGPFTQAGVVTNRTYEETGWGTSFYVPLVPVETQVNYLSSIYYATMVDRVTPGFRSIRPSNLPINTAVKREVSLKMIPAQYRTQGQYFFMGGNYCEALWPYPLAEREILYRQYTDEWDAVTHIFPLSIGDYYEVGLDHQVLLDEQRSYLGGQALKTAVARAKAGEMDILATLGEGRETINYISGRARSIAKIVKRLINNPRLTRRKYNPKDVASLWLEARFAIRPLIGDIENAINALASIHETSRKGKALLSGDSITTEKSFTVATLGHIAQGTTFSCPGVLEITSTPSVSAGCWATFSAGFKSFQFDPVTAAYELMKFSWLIDYVVDIGDTLASLSPRFGVTVGSCWIHYRNTTELRTRFTSTSTTIEMDSNNYCWGKYWGAPPTYIGGHFVPPSIEGEAVMWTRRPADVSERAFLPRIDVNMNWAKYTDVLALLLQSLETNQKSSRAVRRLRNLKLNQ